MFSLIYFNESEYNATETETFAECIGYSAKGNFCWINADFLNPTGFSEMVQHLELHPLMVEDIQNRFQLPKFESFGNIDYLSIQMVKKQKIPGHFELEHVSLLLGKDFVITVQENKQGDVFETLRSRIKSNPKKYYKNGIDYLFLSIVDSIVDEYLSALSAMRQPIEDMEKLMVKKPGLNYMGRIISYKTDISALRKFTSPVKEEIQRIRVENPELIKKQNLALFRDILDHLSTLIANFDNLREMLRDLSELHQSNQNLVLGNTMKTLTVISAIFIPLTFIAGVYGMNFDYMPLLHAGNGFWLIGGLMILITAGLIWFMKRKRWF